MKSGLPTCSPPAAAQCHQAAPWLRPGTMGPRFSARWFPAAVTGEMKSSERLKNPNHQLGS